MNKKNVDSPEGRKKIKGKYMGINVFRGGGVSGEVFSGGQGRGWRIPCDKVKKKRGEKNGKKKEQTDEGQNFRLDLDLHKREHCL
jgi:hypothetical protein